MLHVMIIGAGAIASTHIESYLALKGRVSIAAIADVNLEKAQRLVNDYQLNARAYSDYQEALRQETIDIVSICVPPSLHCKIAVDCLHAGKHVLLEKPMASSLAECDAILEAAQSAHRLISVVAQSRFISSTYHIKQLLDDGICGKLLYSQAYSVWWRGGCYYDLSWRGRWETEGGGCTLNHAVHHIDLLTWMAGMPTEVTAIMANLAHTNSEVEDLSMALLRFEDGSVGQITSSLVHHGEQQQMTFQTERAGISLPFDIQCSKSLPNGFPEPDPLFAEELAKKYHSLPPLKYEGHTGQINHFIDAIENGTPLITDGMAGRNTVEVIMAIYKSASTGMPVKLPIQKEDPFYTQEGLKAAVPHYYEKSKSTDIQQPGKISLASERFHS